MTGIILFWFNYKMRMIVSYVCVCLHVWEAAWIVLIDQIIIYKMGNLCSATIQQDDMSRQQTNISANYQLTTVTMAECTSISVIYGHFNLHHGKVLLSFGSLKTLERIDQLRDYAHQYKNTITKLKFSKSIVNEVKRKKICPYEKVIACILPEYVSTDSEKYQHMFVNVLKDIFEENSDFTIYIAPIGDEGAAISNQMLLALIFRFICKQVSSPKKIALISCEKNILQMIRYEIMKTEKWEGRFDSIQEITP